MNQAKRLTDALVKVFRDGSVSGATKELKAQRKEIIRNEYEAGQAIIATVTKEEEAVAGNKVSTAVNEFDLDVVSSVVESIASGNRLGFTVTDLAVLASNGEFKEIAQQVALVHFAKELKDNTTKDQIADLNTIVKNAIRKTDLLYTVVQEVNGYTQDEAFCALLGLNKAAKNTGKAALQLSNTNDMKKLVTLVNPDLASALYQHEASTSVTIKAIQETFEYDKELVVVGRKGKGGHAHRNTTETFAAIELGKLFNKELITCKLSNIDNREVLFTKDVVKLVASPSNLTGIVYVSPTSGRYITVRQNTASATNFESQIRHLGYSDSSEYTVTLSLVDNGTVTKEATVDSINTLENKMTVDGKVYYAFVMIGSGSDSQRKLGNTQGANYISAVAIKKHFAINNDIVASACREFGQFQNNTAYGIYNAFMSDSNYNTYTGAVRSTVHDIVAKKYVGRYSSTMSGNTVLDYTGKVLYTTVKHSQTLKGVSENDGIAYALESNMAMAGLSSNEGFRGRIGASKTFTTPVGKVYLQAVINKMAPSENADSKTYILNVQNGRVVAVEESTMASASTRQDISMLVDGNAIKYSSNMEQLRNMKMHTAGVVKVAPKVMTDTSYQALDHLNLDDATIEQLAQISVDRVNGALEGKEHITNFGPSAMYDLYNAKKYVKDRVESVVGLFSSGKVSITKGLTHYGVVKPDHAATLGLNILPYLSQEIIDAIVEGYIPVFSAKAKGVQKGLSFRYPSLSGEISKVVIIPFKKVRKALDNMAICPNAMRQLTALGHSSSNNIIKALKREYAKAGFTVFMLDCFVNLLGGFDTDTDSFVITTDPLFIDNVRPTVATKSQFNVQEVSKAAMRTNDTFSALNSHIMQLHVMESNASVGTITKNAEACTLIINAIEQGGQEDIVKSLVQEIASKAYKKAISRNYAGKALSLYRENSPNHELVEAVLVREKEEDFREIPTENMFDVVKIDSATKHAVVAELFFYANNDTCLFELDKIVSLMEKIRFCYSYDQGAAIDVIKKNIDEDFYWLAMSDTLTNQPKKKTKVETLVGDLAEEYRQQNGYTNVSNPRAPIMTVARRSPEWIGADKMALKGNAERVIESAIAKVNNILSEVQLPATSNNKIIQKEGSELRATLTATQEDFMTKVGRMYVACFKGMTNTTDPSEQEEQSLKINKNVEAVKRALASVCGNIPAVDLAKILYSVASTGSSMSQRLCPQGWDEIHYSNGMDSNTIYSEVRNAYASKSLECKTYKVVNGMNLCGIRMKEDFTGEVVCREVVKTTRIMDEIGSTEISTKEKKLFKVLSKKEVKLNDNVTIVRTTNVEDINDTSKWTVMIGSIEDSSESTGVKLAEMNGEDAFTMVTDEDNMQVAYLAWLKK